jgi:hypothetical protein
MSGGKIMDKWPPVYEPTMGPVCNIRQLQVFYFGLNGCLIIDVSKDAFVLRGLIESKPRRVYIL